MAKKSNKPRSSRVPVIGYSEELRAASEKTGVKPDELGSLSVIRGKEKEFSDLLSTEIPSREKRLKKSFRASPPLSDAARDYAQSKEEEKPSFRLGFPVPEGRPPGDAPDTRESFRDKQLGVAAEKKIPRSQVRLLPLGGEDYPNPQKAKKASAVQAAERADVQNRSSDEEHERVRQELVSSRKSARDRNLLEPSEENARALAEAEKALKTHTRRRQARTTEGVAGASSSPTDVQSTSMGAFLKHRISNNVAGMNKARGAYHANVKAFGQVYGDSPCTGDSCPNVVMAHEEGQTCKSCTPKTTTEVAATPPPVSYLGRPLGGNKPVSTLGNPFRRGPRTTRGRALAEGFRNSLGGSSIPQESPQVGSSN